MGEAVREGALDPLLSCHHNRSVWDSSHPSTHRGLCSDRRELPKSRVFYPPWGHSGMQTAMCTRLHEGDTLHAPPWSGTSMVTFKLKLFHLKKKKKHFYTSFVHPTINTTHSEFLRPSLVFTGFPLHICSTAHCLLCCGAAENGQQNKRGQKSGSEKREDCDCTQWTIKEMHMSSGSVPGLCTFREDKAHANLMNAFCAHIHPHRRTTSIIKQNSCWDPCIGLDWKEKINI